jgi:tyrosine aminotransferase
LSTKYRAKSYSITENDVYIVAGGGSSLHLIANLLANPGDNFLFPTPGFPLLLSVAKALSLEVRFYSLKAEQNWEADIKEMDALIDSRTKFIVVNDPSNPLGSCWSNEFKLSILELCRRRNIPLLADEIYETISCDQSLQTFAELSPSNDITIFKASGLTKKYSIPGWRIGWIIVYAEA